MIYAGLYDGHCWITIQTGLPSKLHYHPNWITKLDDSPHRGSVRYIDSGRTSGERRLAELAMNDVVCGQRLLVISRLAVAKAETCEYGGLWIQGFMFARAYARAYYRTIYNKIHEPKLKLACRGFMNSGVYLCSCLCACLLSHYS